MKGWKPIAGVLGMSAILIIGLGLWVEERSAPTPELALNEESVSEDFQAPLSPAEQEIYNTEVSNNMNPTATITTNQGTIVLELFENQMPITVGNFISLAESGFYNDTKFHRVIEGFMIQGGDPNSKGDNQATYGTGGSENIPDEFVEGELLTNTRGTIAMANTGQPNSGSSQFFINLVDNTNLDFDKQPLSSKHPVFGQVVEGMDIVDAIGQTEVQPPANIPVEPIVIESVSIDRS